MKTSFIACLVAAPTLGLLTTQLSAQTVEANIVESASMALDDIMRLRAKRIPHSLLNYAEGIAIVPDVVKAGFVVGVRLGRGVVLVRDDTGAWKPPVFVTLRGGSLGWQAGVQATDVILVFKCRRSVVGLTHQKLTIGVDAAAAAGPVGREAAAATDGRFKAEIYSYSRSRGLFAGVSLDGSVLRVDPFANQAFYQHMGPTLDDTPFNDDVALPLPAVRLMERLTNYAGGPREAEPITATVTEPTIAPITVPIAVQEGVVMGDTVLEAPDSQDQHSTRRALASASQSLHGRLDKSWQSYLVLPAEVFEAEGMPSPASLDYSLKRFDAVANDPQYHSLAQMPEFQSTYRLLKKYANLRAAAPAPHLALPPPPSDLEPQD